MNYSDLRNTLNAVFLLLALIGVIVYFSASHLIGMIIIGVGMLVKTVEFFIRFMF